MNPLTEGNVSKSGHEWLERVNREGMSKHTPGPWSVIPYGGIGANGEKIDGFDIGCDLCRDGFHKIAKLETTKWSRDELANANLIAAAPDLLEALENLFLDYKQLADSGDAGFWKLEDRDVGKQAMAAIARAKGESQ